MAEAVQKMLRLGALLRDERDELLARWREAVRRVGAPRRPPYRRVGRVRRRDLRRAPGRGDEAADEEHLAFIAHDLKTPLSAVDMASRLLEQGLPEESKTDKNRVLLETLRRNVGRLRALVRAAAREDTRIDARAELVLRRREFDLWPLVQGLVYDLRPPPLTSRIRGVGSNRLGRRRTSAKEGD